MVSIIIPVFNSQDYLRECMESVHSQTFCDWECVIVDDGSTDESVQIATEFAKSDQRFKVFSIQHLGNPQNVRHFARLQSTGDWFLGLDADDFLAADCLEKLIERQKQTNADAVLLQLNLFENNTRQTIQKIPDTAFDFSQITTGSEAVMKTVGKWEIAINGLFRKDLYNLQNTISDDLLNLDEYISQVVLFEAKTVVFSDAPYFYRQHAKSLTKNLSKKLFTVIHTDKLLEKLIVLRFGEDSAEAQKACDTALKNLLYLCAHFFQNRKFFSKDEQKCIKVSFSKAFSDLSKVKIWRGKLPFLKKCILTLPAAIIFIAVNFSVFSRKKLGRL
jgi:glycosyltransferase involved in cell wall biosynthesis